MQQVARPPAGICREVQRRVATHPPAAWAAPEAGRGLTVGRRRCAWRHPQRPAPALGRTPAAAPPGRPAPAGRGCAGRQGTAWCARTGWRLPEQLGAASAARSVHSLSKALRAAAATQPTQRTSPAQSRLTCSCCRRPTTSASPHLARVRSTSAATTAATCPSSASLQRKGQARGGGGGEAGEAWPAGALVLQAASPLPRRRAPGRGCRRLQLTMLTPPWHSKKQPLTVAAWPGPARTRGPPAALPARTSS